MLSDLCLLTTTAPREVVGSLVSIVVARPDLKDQKDRKFFFVDSNASRDGLVEKNNYVSY